MDQTFDTVTALQKPEDLAKLVRKLRWIGLEGEAHQLQIAAMQRSIVLAEPPDTD